MKQKSCALTPLVYYRYCFKEAHPASNVTWVTLEMPIVILRLFRTKRNCHILHTTCVISIHWLRWLEVAFIATILSSIQNIGVYLVQAFCWMSSFWAKKICPISPGCICYTFILSLQTMCLLNGSLTMTCFFTQYLVSLSIMP